MKYTLKTSALLINRAIRFLDKRDTVCFRTAHETLSIREADIAKAEMALIMKTVAPLRELRKFYTSERREQTKLERLQSLVEEESYEEDK